MGKSSKVNIQSNYKSFRRPSELKLITIGFTAFLLSCSDVDCNFLTNSIREKHCNIIVSDLPTQGRHFVLRGRNPVTNRRQSYVDESGWYLFFYKKIEKGDTIVKNYGDLTFHIHKKDTVLVYTYRCNGKTYN